MGAILVLTAVELEARALARALGLAPLPSLPFQAYGRGGFVVAPVGVGAALLDARWPSLVPGSAHPLVVSAGVCGGLDPALRVGDLVLADSVLDGGGRRLAVTGFAERHALAAACGGARAGALASIPAAAATPAAKAALRQETGAIAVDMESAAILGKAAAHGCASIVVRAVSDAAAASLPAELLGMVDADGRVRARGVWRLARPRLLLRAWGLRRATRRALEAVALALRRLAA